MALTRTQYMMLDMSDLEDELRQNILDSDKAQPPCPSCGYGIPEQEARAGFAHCEHC